MNFKRFLALALSGALTLSLLTACGGKESGDHDSVDTPAPTQPVVEATETPDPVETPAETAEPEVTPAPVEPTVAPVEPDQTPDQNNPTDGSASNTAADVWAAVSEGLDLPMFMDLDDDLLSSLYYLDANLPEDYVAKMPMMNTQATEFFIAKVKDGEMSKVKDAVFQRKTDMEEQWSMYLPEQLELVKDYRMVENGDWLMFVVSEYATDASSRFLNATN